MTATYQKPVILFESFELSQTVAESCGVPAGGTSLGKPNQADKTTCGWNVGGLIIWMDNTEICNAWQYGMSYNENSVVNGMCYNAPSSGYTIFNS